MSSIIEILQTLVGIPSTQYANELVFFMGCIIITFLFFALFDILRGIVPK